MEAGPTDLRVASLDAHVDPRTLRSEALEPWTGEVPLKIPVDISLRGQGWLDDAAARGTIQTGAGNARLRASWEDSVASVRLETDDLRLGDLLDVPAASVARNVQVSLDSDLRIELEGEALRYDEYAVPEVRAEAQPGALAQMPASASLADVVSALNALGAKPRDLVAIFQALRTAGALQAHIEVQ